MVDDDPTPFCGHCRYSLVGVASADASACRCPECGVTAKPLYHLPPRSRLFGIATVFGMPTLLMVLGVLLIDSGWVTAGVAIWAAVLAWPALAGQLEVKDRVPPRHERGALISIWITGWCVGILLLIIGAAASMWMHIA